MICFHCGVEQQDRGDGKCSSCGGRLETLKDDVAVVTNGDAGGFLVPTEFVLSITGEKPPLECCTDCGSQLVKGRTKHVRYLAVDQERETGLGKNRRLRFFRMGSPKRRVVYRCPNRRWWRWRCSDQNKYYLWPDGSLTKAGYYS